MEYPQLTFTESDPTPLNLDADQKEVITESIKDICKNLMLFQHLLNEDNNLETGIAHNVVSVVNYKLDDIAKITNYENRLKKMKESDTQTIKDLSNYIRELKKQLGDAHPLRALGDIIKKAKNTIRLWCSEIGFLFDSEYEFGEYDVLTCNLRVGFDFLHYSLSEKPVSRRQSLESKIKEHITNGLIILPPQDNLRPTDQKIDDNDSNKIYIQNLLVQRFPNSRINSFKTLLHSQNKKPCLYYISYIHTTIPYDNLVQTNILSV